PQLRLQAVPQRGRSRGGDLRRAAPVRAGAGSCPRISRRRDRGEPSTPAAWVLEVWLVAVPQGLPRSLDGTVPDPVPAAAAARPGGNGPCAPGPGSAGAWLPGRPLDPRFPTNRQPPDALLLDHPAGRGSAASQPGHPGRAGHCLQYPVRRDTYSIAETTTQARPDSSAEADRRQALTERGWASMLG